ncbi:hypothetical protein Tco_1033099, partial [Tanacetum coccineum]
RKVAAAAVASPESFCRRFLARSAACRCQRRYFTGKVDVAAAGTPETTLPLFTTDERHTTPSADEPTITDERHKCYRTYPIHRHILPNQTTADFQGSESSWKCFDGFL